MQIIRTEVTQATAPTGQPILRVIFCGEGGDCVAVDLARVDGGNNEAAINRAKAVLVQIATFDLAVNDYDARSNGNFDEVAVTAANDENGGHYIFEYRRTRPSGSSLQDAKFRGCAGGSGSMRYRSSGRPSAGHGRSFRLARAPARRERRTAVRHRRAGGASGPPDKTMNRQRLKADWQRCEATAGPPGLRPRSDRDYASPHRGRG